MERAEWLLLALSVKIMADESREAEPGERGEIVIRGENVMKGYFLNPEATADVLKDDWLWTGDLGYFDADGFLVVTGRAKALLISPDGEKYSPEENEESILNHCDIVSQVMVFNDHRNFTTALVTLQRGPAETLLKERGVKSAEEALKVLHEELYAFEPELS